MSPSARKILVALSTGLLLGLLAACSKQGEGERCDSKKAGDADCEDGLVCLNLNASEGSNGEGVPLERCCPPPGQPSSTDRCNPVEPSPSGTAGSSSGGTSGNGAGGATGTDAGSGGEPVIDGGTGGVPVTDAGSGGMSVSDAGSGGASNPAAGGTDASSGAGGA